MINKTLLNDSHVVKYQRINLENYLANESQINIRDTISNFGYNIKDNLREFKMIGLGLVIAGFGSYLVKHGMDLNQSVESFKHVYSSTGDVSNALKIGLSDDLLNSVHVSSSYHNKITELLEIGNIISPSVEANSLLNDWNSKSDLINPMAEVNSTLDYLSEFKTSVNDLANPTEYVLSFLLGRIFTACGVILAVTDATFCSRYIHFRNTGSYNNKKLLQNRSANTDLDSLENSKNSSDIFSYLDYVSKTKSVHEVIDLIKLYTKIPQEKLHIDG
jgi:hypothetical protein